MQCSILGWILDWEKITTNGVLGTVAAAAAAKLLQSRPTLCDHIDGSPQALPSLGFSRQNTGVGCHFLLQGMKVKSESEVAWSCLTLRHHGLQSTRLLHPWDLPGKSTGVDCHCLFHGDRWRNLNMDCMLYHRQVSWI